MRIINSKSIRLCACFERLKSQLAFETEKKGAYLHNLIVLLAKTGKPNNFLCCFLHVRAIGKHLLFLPVPELFETKPSRSTLYGANVDFNFHFSLM